MTKRLALFDLDNTLLAGDSDHAWGEFLIAENLVDGAAHRARNDAFYQQYLAGELDIHAYVEFTLAPVRMLSADERQVLHSKFLQQVVQPMVLEKGQQLVQAHRDQGDTCIIITATNAFITSPIAKLFAVDILLATDLEQEKGKLTGKIAGTPCYQQGKVEKLQQWIQSSGDDFIVAESSFYTDSINDLPLMEMVAEPVAVDPDDELATIAAQREWQTISLRS